MVVTKWILYQLSSFMVIQNILGTVSPCDIPQFDESLSWYFSLLFLDPVTKQFDTINVLILPYLISSHTLEKLSDNESKT